MISVRHERWAIAIVSFILGFMVVSQYKMTQDNIEENIRLQRAGDLAVQLKEAQQERDALLKHIETLKKSGAGGDAKADEQLMMKAALTNVKGPGVSVLIEDSSKPIQGGENPNLYVIHDEDILRIVNELRAGGAEAIAINDQRLIGTSEIRCSGPTITVNGKVFGAPFVVKAIGDPKTLNSALTMRGGVVDSLKHWGIKVTIKQEDFVAVPAFTGTFREEHMMPNELGGKE
ncbi:DUF881 domain-containing protein [Veillonella denticariosi]|uniref:DUF881 domain-containing protein n=1 Tax=Veillonella denticariosi TaxID=419208 RepID=UPI002493A486|nr:DUF881 domain-containing protein [Veillonella denticariosi]